MARVIRENRLLRARIKQMARERELLIERVAHHLESKGQADEAEAIRRLCRIETP